MSREVRYLRRAQADMEAISPFLHRADPFAAPKVLAALLERIESLGLVADRGSVPRDERLRRAGYRFVRSGRYVVFYRSSPQWVRVHRVLHHRRAYASLLR